MPHACGAPDAATTSRAHDIVAAGWPIGPRPHPCTCGALRHAHHGDQRTGGHPPTGCTNYHRDPADQLAETALDNEQPTLVADLIADDPGRPATAGRWGIGPSDAGQCRRAIWYRECPPADYTPLPDTSGQAALGKAIHRAWELASAARYPWREHELDITVPGFDRDGRIDRYDPVLGDVDDAKTAGRATWSYIGDHGPRPSAWSQLLIYAHALHTQGRPVRRLRLIYINRDSSAEEVFVRAWDDAARADAAREVARLHAVLTALDVGRMLPRDRSGPTNDPICRLCPARRHCWNLDAAEAADRSPESYDALGPYPDDAVIRWACEEVVAARDAKNAAKEEKDAKQALVDGLEPGRYGDYTVANRRSGDKPDWKTAYHTLRELYELPEGFRPPAKRLPAPPVTPGTPYTLVSRVRAAKRQKHVPAQPAHNTATETTT